MHCEQNTSTNPLSDLDQLRDGSVADATAALKRLVALWSQSPVEARASLEAGLSGALQACISHAETETDADIGSLLSTCLQAVHVLQALGPSGDCLVLEPVSQDITSLPLFDNSSCKQPQIVSC